MSPSSSSNVNLQFIADQFARGLEEIKRTLETLQEQVQANAVEMASVQKDLENLHEKINDLFIVVRGEDGSYSILNRVTTLENEHKETYKWIEEQKQKNNEKSKEGFQLKIAIVTGSFAFIVAAIDIVLQIIK